MSLSSGYKTDAAKVEKGVPVKRDPNEDGSVPTFHLAFMGKTHKAYQLELERSMRPHRPDLSANRLQTAVAEEIMLNVFCKTILKGWDNVLLSDVTGNPDDVGFAEFNRENATKLLTNLPMLFEDLQTEASNVEKYKLDHRNGDLKN